MNLSSIYFDLHKASKDFYDAAGRYFAEKEKLAKSLSDTFQAVGTKLTTEQMDMIRKSPAGQYSKEARNKNLYNFESAYRHYQHEFDAAAESLADAVDEYQPRFDVNDNTLQNSLMIAKIGKNLPRSAARDLLQPLRTNKRIFNIVKGALENSGVDPSYIRDIYPFDGESMADDYSFMVEDLRGESDEKIYTKLQKIQDRLIDDAAAFGVSLDKYTSDDIDSNAIMSAAIMGVKTPHEKAVEVLDAL